MINSNDPSPVRYGWIVRLLVAVLATPVVFMFFAPTTHRYEELTYAPESVPRPVHIGRLLRHVEGIQSGSYLVGHNGHSVTRESPDDVGGFVWLADVALARKLLGLGPPAALDVYRMKLFFISFALALILLCGQPLSTAVAFLGVVTLFGEKWAWIHESTDWPTILVIALTLVLLDALLRAVVRPDIAPNLATLVALSSFVGVLGYFRADGVFVARLPFVALLAINLLSLHVVFRPPKVRLRNWKLNHLAALAVQACQSRDIRVRAAIASAAVLFGLTVVPSLLLHANIALFEYLDEVQHQPTGAGRHIKWGPLYLGLGENYKNTGHVENILWEDSKGRLIAQKENGFFRAWDRHYENALKSRYIDVALNNTPFVLSTYLPRLRGLLKAVGRNDDYSYFSLLICLALATMTGILYRQFRPQTSYQRYSDVCFILAASSILVGAGIPALASLGRVPGFFPAVGGVAWFGMVVLVRRVDEDGDADGALLAMHHRGRLVMIASAVVAAAVLLNAGRISWRRTSLSVGLEQGDVAVTALFEHYHADGVVAFNSLPAATREELGERLLTAEGLGTSVQVGIGDDLEHYLPLHVRWHGDYLFLVARFPARLTDRYVIPVNLNFRQIKHLMTTDLLVLPRNLDAGTWLFSLRVPREHITALTLREAQPAKNSTSHLYTTTPLTNRTPEPVSPRD